MHAHKRLFLRKATCQIDTCNKTIGQTDFLGETNHAMREYPSFSRMVNPSIMLDLNLSEYAWALKIKTHQEIAEVWDPVRRRWVKMFPEEFVRQLTLAFLITQKGYPAGRIAVEKTLQCHHLTKRCDILVYAADGSPFLLVECKAPQIPLGTEVFLQAANYNLALQVPYLMMTNGPYSYGCSMDYRHRKVAEISEIPEYPADA